MQLLQTMTPHSLPVSSTPGSDTRSPVPCPFCGKALPVWAAAEATAMGVWVKCKNPACRREVEIKI